MELPKNYNHKEIEEKWQKTWEKNKIYKFDEKSKESTFSIDTPPPYVSAAHLHIGHAMHYSQFEFIARYQKMKGKNVFFPMGFDDNGLPTERYVEKKYNIDKNKVNRDEFLKLCLKETELGRETYKRLWNSLGFSIDWGLTYSTIDKHSTKIAQKSFLDLYKKGLLKREDLPVIWDTKLQTTLAQADLVDLEKESFFNDIVFTSGKDKLVISTTRPELLPACVALFYNPKDKKYSKLKDKKCKVPLFDYEVPILSDESVEMDKGTGLMMVCTFGDKYDIEKWAKYNLPLRVVITENGRMNKLAEKYEGLTTHQAREKIIEDLKEKKLLLKQEKIKHVVNVSERSGAEIEFLKSPQWVINLLDHKRALISQGKKIKWYPDYMRKRYEAWVENLNWNWIISRQRYYGVPFPVWYDKKTGGIILASEDELPVDPRNGDVPKGYKNFNVIPEMDVMDTWMTSSMTPEIVANWKEKNERNILPMSLRPQAHDIIRTWAFYTIAKSYFHNKEVPWKEIILSGHGLDSQGRKMSKSLNNFVEPSEVINKYSADALRFWAANAKLGQDVSYKEEEVKAGQKTIIKLFNANKFADVHLKNYKTKKVNLLEIDRGILSKFNTLIKGCTEAFDNYEYSKSKNLIEGFFWSETCDNYLEIIKNRLYNGTGDEKLSAQYVLNYLMENTLKLFAPIMPFITEEIYGWRNKDSIHLQSWPKYDKTLDDKTSENIWEKFISILGEVRQAKTKNNVSLKAEIELELSKEDYKTLESSINDLKSVCNAKTIIIGNKLKVKWM